MFYHLFLSDERRSFCLSYTLIGLNMKVKFMHNLLTLAPIYHLKRAKNLSQVFIFLKKKSVQQIRPTELLK